MWKFTTSKQKQKVKYFLIQSVFAIRILSKVKIKPNLNKLITLTSIHLIKIVILTKVKRNWCFDHILTKLSQKSKNYDSWVSHLVFEIFFVWNYIHLQMFGSFKTMFTSVHFTFTSDLSQLYTKIYTQFNISRKINTSSIKIDRNFKY